MRHYLRSIHLHPGGEAVGSVDENTFLEVWVEFQSVSLAVRLCLFCRAIPFDKFCSVAACASTEAAASTPRDCVYISQSFNM